MRFQSEQRKKALLVSFLGQRSYLDSHNAPGVGNHRLRALPDYTYKRLLQHQKNTCSKLFSLSREQRSQLDKHSKKIKVRNHDACLI